MYAIVLDFCVIKISLAPFSKRDSTTNIDLIDYFNEIYWINERYTIEVHFV